MFDHIGFRVRDLAASRRFYETALKPLGHVVAAEGEGYVGLGPAGAPALWLYASDAGAGPGCHAAFTAPDHAAVHAFHEGGLATGGRDNGAPGPRPDYSATYYAAFLIDPDGNNVEAVCP
jgi:catechol 2,3-dioxygenase-like lactoylglutathione lyase family enzyme